jgi:hypothetical protein
MQDWGGGFTLSGLIIAVFTMLLALIAVSEYLGLEKVIDDELESNLDLNNEYKPRPEQVMLPKPDR